MQLHMLIYDIDTQTDRQMIDQTDKQAKDQIQTHVHIHMCVHICMCVFLYMHVCIVRPSTKARALHMQGMCSITELCPQPISPCFLWKQRFIIVSHSQNRSAAKKTKKKKKTFSNSSRQPETCQVAKAEFTLWSSLFQSPVPGLWAQVCKVSSGLCVFRVRTLPAELHLQLVADSGHFSSPIYLSDQVLLGFDSLDIYFPEFPGKFALHINSAVPMHGLFSVRHHVQSPIHYGHPWIVCWWSLQAEREGYEKGQPSLCSA